MSYNNIGELVLPDGWTKKQGWSSTTYKHSDGREQKEHPGKPEGVIAITNAISTNGAMTSLNVSSNRLFAEGAKHIAAALPQCK